jgi:hypothetical protein
MIVFSAPFVYKEVVTSDEAESPEIFCIAQHPSEDHLLFRKT